MGTYDVMQVCLNGHKITHTYKSNPELQQDHCDECGEETIHECPKCGTPIRGEYLVEGAFFSGGPEPPEYCHECGESYPWAREGEKFANVDSSVLDEELAERVLSIYENGQYQDVVRNAFIVLEERVRDKGGFSEDKCGVNLMTESFNPADPGPLAMGKTNSEKEGTMLLYRSVFMALRNPVSHRFIEEIDQDYARDIIHTVNLLLRSIDEEADTN